MPMPRRALAIGLTAFAVAIRPERSSAAGTFEVSRSDEEWRRRLTAQQYAVLRRNGTERPYSSALNGEHRRGTFFCVGCDRPLFSSDAKFESGTGWPSFWTPLRDAIGTEEDRSYGMVRVAVHCAGCGGHLGHVFDDGPRPTGLRYCMNGVALYFRAADA